MYRSLALCAFFVVPVIALSACGNDVPGNAVARIEDQTIKKSTFDHWMRIAAVSRAGQTSPNPTAAQVPDPPDFNRCVAAKRKTAPKPRKGQPEPTVAQFKAQCKQEYDGLKDQVLQFLIRSTWLDGEAQKQGIKLSDKEVQKQIDTLKKRSFPKEEDFQKFIQRAGLTEADIFFQQRAQLLEQKITQKVTKGKDKVTDQQIADYYKKNKQRFSTPERRDMRIVLTKGRPRAEQAKAALDRGESWKSVARRYSIDTTKSQGGKLPGVAKGQQEKALDEAIFSAPKGRLVGPVKTQFGFYLFEVTRITPGRQQSLEQSKATIRQILASENQRKALDRFGKDYQKRWREATQCREGYTTLDCSNAPKKDNEATAPGAQTAPRTQTQP